MVWDLNPPVNPAEKSDDASNDSVSPGPRPQPTVYAIPFAHSLTSVNSHVATSKEFLVSDDRGSIFMLDWRSEPDDRGPNNAIELQEPRALSDVSLGLANQWSGSVSWRRDSADMYVVLPILSMSFNNLLSLDRVGAVYRSRFSIWDVSKLQGGKPMISGTSFPDGGHRFRWCHNYPEYFAISSQSPLRGALVHVHNLNYVHAAPTAFTLAPKPHYTQDFDFLGGKGIPRLVVAFGQTIMVFPIGVPSTTT
jgi:hypothetical protein